MIRMKRSLCLLLLGSLLLVSCHSPSKDQIALRIVCESEGIYQLFYSIYLGDQPMGMGGMADLEHKPLTPETELEVRFSKERLDGAQDLSQLMIELSAYGEHDRHEIGTSNKLRIPAEYGQVYRLIFSGDVNRGFKLTLSE